MFRSVAFTALALLAAAPAFAEGNLSLSVTGGTLGVGPQLAYRINKSFGLRADATFLAFSHGFNSNDLHYDGHAHLQSAGTAIDIYPFGGNFRFSLGGRENGNRASVEAMPTSDANVGGMVFTPQQIGSLLGQAKVRSVAPTATIGFSGKLKRGFMIGVDAGVMFQGMINLSKFTSSTGLIPQTRLEQEEASLQRDLSRFKVYPILQLALGYRF
ncbi:hypothetical protein [Sphingomonas nostoxanthinifaciens]|uniref:hypothetical protein n=1 Tax=Sphingomonas nostoxanthinifaciens TaxID=2872652 RepID=UPI001CC1DC05|nr:hypothetical protein [Sphingomonas nostoxanthinifaciens]UAK25369.1 hypothetical protein K8P63_04075 [Sphingomonas nostoxanthinifaciens]